MICLSCGKINESDAEKCVQCGSALSKMAKSPPRLYGHLFHLQEAGRDVTLGQITIEEFADILKKIEEVLEEKFKEIIEMDLPDDLKEEFNLEINTGVEGIKHFREAIATLKKYIKDRNLQHLHTGMTMAEIATQKLNEALALNWQNYLRWQETMEEFLHSREI